MIAQKENRPKSNSNIATLDGKYTIQRTIGRRITCKVKLGLLIATGQAFAIKIFHSNELNEVKANNEVQALTQLNH